MSDQPEMKKRRVMRKPLSSGMPQMVDNTGHTVVPTERMFMMSSLEVLHKQTNATDSTNAKTVEYSADQIDPLELRRRDELDKQESKTPEEREGIEKIKEDLLRGVKIEIAPPSLIPEQEKRDSAVADHLEELKLKQDLDEPYYDLTPVPDSNSDSIHMAPASYTNTIDHNVVGEMKQVDEIKNKFCNKHELRKMGEKQTEMCKWANFLLKKDVVHPVALRKNHNRKLDDDMKFRCIFCPKMDDIYGEHVKRWFARKEDLVRHYKQHLEVKNVQCSVQGCTYKCTRKDHLKRHIENKHSATKSKKRKAHKRVPIAD